MTDVLLCAECSRAVRPGQAYTFREVVAWEEINRRGGPGNLKQKRYTGKVLCLECGGAPPPGSDLFGASL